MRADVFVRRRYRCSADPEHGEFSTISIYYEAHHPDDVRPSRCPVCSVTQIIPFDEQLALTPETAIEFLERAAIVARKGISE